MRIKTAGKRGQISLGVGLTGTSFFLENLSGGDILLKRDVVVPANERWFDEPAVKARLARAVEWARNTPPQETDLDKLASKLSRGETRSRTSRRLN